MENRIKIGPEAAGLRLDVVVSRSLPEWSRSRVQRAIKAGQVSVDGTPEARPSSSVPAGAREITLAADEAFEISTDVSGGAITSLDVIHADEHIAVIHKPAGLLTHANSAQGGGSLADLAVERFGSLPEVQGENRPGIVHRLDRLTSGVIVLGLTEAALLSLKEQFKARTVEKTYHAVVHNLPRFETEWLTGAIETHPKSGDRMRVVPRGQQEERLQEGAAREAETFMETLETFGDAASLVAAHPKSGRRHQIRVHLQAAGLPIIGDRVYGHRGSLKVPLPSGAPAMERPALHARNLSFDHPATGERMAFEAPIPPDMGQLIEFLRGA